MEEIVKQTHIQPETLYEQIREILKAARTKVATTVNTAMVQAYWSVGKLIVDAQGGEERAAYGNELLKSISVRLTKEFGRVLTHLT